MKTNSTIFIFTPFDVYAPGNMGNQQDVANRTSLFCELGADIALIQLVSSKKDFCIVKDNQYIKSIKIFGDFEKNHHAKQKAIKEAIAMIANSETAILLFEYYKLVWLALAVREIFPSHKIYFRSHNYETGHRIEKNVYALKRDWRQIIKLPFVIRGVLSIRQQEKLMFAIADKVFSISFLDIKKYQEKSSIKNIVYLPFFKEYHAEYQTKKYVHPLRVLYLGSDLSNVVNRSGVEYIYEKIIPRVKNKDIFFHILGKNYPPAMRHPQIRFEGFIEDVLFESFLHTMDVAVVPVDIGYGMKIKAYEVLKRGFPTILSQRCHEIFGGMDKKDYFVAQKPQEWAHYTELLCDERTREEMSANAREFMQNRFNKEYVLQTLQHEL